MGRNLVKKTNRKIDMTRVAGIKKGKIMWKPKNKRRYKKQPDKIDLPLGPKAQKRLEQLQAKKEKQDCEEELPDEMNPFDIIPISGKKKRKLLRKMKRLEKDRANEGSGSEYESEDQQQEKHNKRKAASDQMEIE